TNVANINAVLTIEPGVKVEFASGARMDIETTGTLVAVGTESDSIVFTGANQTAGFWDGIFVISA
ncbi:MAG: right-handed parallel beta-helix repeat-containing protein, partial [Aliifodinibius sp.]|nr:right-handed parallel beta-helix repeat-containing protein [candidate division Zixibacteria bacterium]NIT58878.1 right-handed parallel beta-helix repeat-containing protein [Fodinibius sp.]NIR67836.1 right-handed parallel beta-helix repeat-containing protein [candidate division Zixibacteria bacterium]NIS49061.1 right-handed parallel beta-helix repeat-containing protein [candidate division Zixibacteria bacterium]NIU17147.1 right-handed parallel beta-helix repeat-containing protein [candidate d